MEDQKPTSIKTIGLLVVLFSIFIIFSNGMGMLAWFSFEKQDDPSIAKSEITDPISFLFAYYFEICLLMLVLGSAYLIGGLFIRKYKLWANKLVSGLSLLILLIMWGIMIGMTVSIGWRGEFAIFSLAAIITAAFWSTPIGLLIVFLNKEKNKKHFS